MNYGKCLRHVRFRILVSHVPTRLPWFFMATYSGYVNHATYKFTEVNFAYLLYSTIHVLSFIYLFWIHACFSWLLFQVLSIGVPSQLSRTRASIRSSSSYEAHYLHFHSIENEFKDSVANLCQPTCWKVERDSCVLLLGLFCHAYPAVALQNISNCIPFRHYHFWHKYETYRFLQKKYNCEYFKYLSILSRSKRTWKVRHEISKKSMIFVRTLKSLSNFTTLQGHKIEMTSTKKWTCVYSHSSFKLGMIFQKYTSLTLFKKSK